MAAVDLTGWLYLNLASDPLQFWRFQFITGLQSTPAVTFSGRPYAQAVFRKIRTPGRQSVMAVSLVACTAVDRQALEFDLLGVTLWVRDDRGRKFAGFYSDPQITEHQYNDECDVTLTFTEVTLSETVAVTA